MLLLTWNYACIIGASLQIGVLKHFKHKLLLQFPRIALNSLCILASKTIHCKVLFINNTPYGRLFLQNACIYEIKWYCAIQYKLYWCKFSWQQARRAASKQEQKSWLEGLHTSLHELLWANRIQKTSLPTPQWTRHSITCLLGPHTNCTAWLFLHR